MMSIGFNYFIMKNQEEQQTEERVAVRTVNHFGGKHKTIYYNDGTTCNVYNDGYKSNNETVIKNFSDMNTNTNTKTANKPAKASKTKVKKPVKKVDTDAAVVVNQTDASTATPKVSRGDVKTAVENFLKNPPDKALTLAEVYETIGFAHRQVYMMVREHGVPAGKKDGKAGKGRKETLFTFNKTA